jgi:hypothetical protein
MSDIDIAAGADDAWPLERGDTIRRKELHDRWKSVRQGGVSPSSTTPNVFLFTDEIANAAHGFARDRWVRPDLFIYCGTGQSDQSLQGYNGSILTHRETARSLRLFDGWREVVTYVGEFTIDSVEPFFWVTAKNRDGADRRVVMFRLRPVRFQGPQVVPDHTVIDQVPLDVGGSTSAPSVKPYVAANEAIQASERIPFGVDPDLVDRSLRSHATTQNLLAEWLRSAGLEPLSPGGEPRFDLAWDIGETGFVAEVKSLRRENEIGQLRLGLGQVLDYADQLSRMPVLMLERRPTADRWLQICDRLNVRLLWPARLDEVQPRAL